jgi:putative FmdB family regulatory protein
VPIFEYRCSKCGEMFERLVRAAAETVECPGCASRRVVRLLSAPSIPRSAAGTAFRSGGDGCCSGGGCGCHN